MSENLYAGFDLSTTQLKALVVRSDLKLVYEAQVTFDEDLGKYGITKGVLTNPSEGEIFAPNAMWLEALDLVLERLKSQGLDFSLVRGVSGAGMQHGTVFWSHKAEQLLAGLSGTKTLVEQLADDRGTVGSAFGHKYSPNWQDASTQKQCDAFDVQLGDEETLADVTGSKAHHRFSGPQILRFREKYPEAYQNTSRISLVSSFLASILLGQIAPIDISDVGGMNLWHIGKGCWHEGLLGLAAGDSGLEELKKKLGPVPEDGGGSLGNVSKYFVEKYGFDPHCQVAPFTGDNPSTILALPLRASDAIVSLGTSTTFLMSTPEYRPDPSYHFMNHPTTAGLYMFMLCYKNGSLARENIRDALNAAAGTETPSEPWSLFNKVTATYSPPLNQHAATDSMRLGLFFPRPEIVPNLPAGTWTYLYDPSAAALTPADPSTAPLPPVTALAAPESAPPAAQQGWLHPLQTARAVVESQFLSLRLRSAKLVQAQVSPATGAALPPQPRRVYLVGGGSVNPAIAQICGEVLGGAEGVFRLDIGGNACALGAAYKAVWARERAPGETFEDLIGARWDEEGFVRKVDVGYREGLWERYGEAVGAFGRMEERVLDEVKSSKRNA